MSGRFTGLLLGAAALALVVAGFAGASSATTQVTKQPKIAKEVPSKIRSKGTLTVATDATYAPMEFFASNGKTIVGVDADLAKALGTVLGLNFKVVNGTFATIIPGLASGKYDVGMSSFTDTKARQKKVDFVTYFDAGTSFYVKAWRPEDQRPLVAVRARPSPSRTGQPSRADATAQTQEVHERRQVRRERLRLQRPERGEPGVVQRSRPGRHGRLAGCGVHRQAVARAVQAQRQVRTGWLPTGSRCRSATAWRSRSSPR